MFGSKESYKLEIKEQLEIENGGKYSKFVLEPLPPGYGVTIGNALRRILLTSIPGSAVIAVRVDDAPHEYMTLPGMVEDILEFHLNLKKLVVAILADISEEETRKLILDVKGPKIVKASDIQPNAEVQIINKDLYLATLEENGELRAEITVKKGKGYMSIEKMKENTRWLSPGSIPLDANFLPITRVNYSVESTRVGQETDWDKLIFEIWTNGAIEPVNALRIAAEDLISYFRIFAEYGTFLDTQMPVSDYKEIKKDSYLKSQTKMDLEQSIEEIGLQTRIANVLKRSGISTLGDLISKTREDILNVPSFGKKSLDELEEILHAKGYRLKSSDENGGEDFGA
ncbi:DNA-directed RNA polymerase subunit alpha [Thermodesulfobium acidiphilum]|uniref:DNA-directed RNA polymerase subunit alpha n=1 Tax=Thermodesulfobium acidiphilum TaxID=1794699 RepID=A0A2R4VZN5_THEAF|nr:DNA-directed RNA polymerase subunit alpha [Thermodesulfobium acidiphilum]AWB09880.1 DNA-directed RNA polymerase subunit alpha [Thermodesulfobium acidiphilum]